MKANVPEKIYINSNLENRTWLIGKGDIDFIEYVRADVLIEKACAWLEPVLKNYAGYYAGTDTLEDFRNYMKGE